MAPLVDDVEFPSQPPTPTPSLLSAAVRDLIWVSCSSIQLIQGMGNAENCAFMWEKSRLGNFLSYFQILFMWSKRVRATMRSARSDGGGGARLICILVTTALLLLSAKSGVARAENAHYVVKEPGADDAGDKVEATATAASVVVEEGRICRRYARGGVADADELWFPSAHSPHQFLYCDAETG